MGRTGISQEQVNAVADRIADTDGMAAVSLRRVRRELGTGSMQTIHRMLASWRALADLRKPAPTADQTTLPVRFMRTQYGAVGPLVLLVTLLTSVLVRN